jgi:hypothetical protein
MVSFVNSKLFKSVKFQINENDSPFLYMTKQFSVSEWEIHCGNNSLFQEIVLSNMDMHVQNNEAEPSLPLSMYKNQLKIDQRYRPKSWNYKTFKENVGKAS